MIRFRRLCLAAGVAAALTVFAAPASAQSVVTYALAGVETAATSTQGTFVGVALAPDDFGTWGAVILHDPLASPDPQLTGGGFAIDGFARDLQGIITGGTITRLGGGSCRKEAFTVEGDVFVVTGGLGEFNVKLTHYGFRLPTGGCFTYFATVEGLITFALP